jgi:hypothetical protein
MPRMSQMSPPAIGKPRIQMSSDFWYIRAGGQRGRFSFPPSYRQLSSLHFLYHQTHREIRYFHQIYLNIIKMSAPVGPIIAQLQQLPARSRQGLNNLRQRLFQQGTFSLNLSLSSPSFHQKYHSSNVFLQRPSLRKRASCSAPR